MPFKGKYAHLPLHSVIQKGDGGLTEVKYGIGIYQGTSRGGYSLRPSDKEMESEDEALHLRREKRHPHRRFAENGRDVQQGAQLYFRHGGKRGKGPFRGDEKAGPVGDRRGSRKSQDFLCEQEMARRNSNEFLHDKEKPEQDGRDRGCSRKVRSRDSRRRKSSCTRGNSRNS